MNTSIKYKQLVPSFETFWTTRSIFVALKFIFVQAFNLDKWDDNKIDEDTKKLYENYDIENKFREIFKIIKTEKTIFSQYMLFYNEDSSFFDLFRLLFSYETFYLLHKFICDLENKQISNIKLINNIIKEIKKIKD